MDDVLIGCLGIAFLLANYLLAVVILNVIDCIKDLLD